MKVSSWGARVSTIAPLVPSAVGPEGTDAMAASSSSSSGEQQYSLRWNDFHSSILSSFRHLRDEEDFVDVTLACDSSSFTAHKVVLSACSPYFRRLLKVSISLFKFSFLFFFFLLQTYTDFLDFFLSSFFSYCQIANEIHVHYCSQVSGYLFIFIGDNKIAACNYQSL